MTNLDDKRGGQFEEKKRDEILKRLLHTPPQPRPKRDREKEKAGGKKVAPRKPKS